MILAVILPILTFWIVSRGDRWDRYRTWEQVYLIVMLVLSLLNVAYQVVTRLP